MSGFLATYRVGLVQAGEADVLVRPHPTTNRIGVVACHGAGGSAQEFTLASKWSRGLAQALASAGYTVLGSDLGGPTTFGNDVVAARIEAARLALVALGCYPRIVLLGGSMGTLSALRYAADNPANVRSVIGYIPGVDVDDMRARDVLGLRTAIEAAWGLGASDPIPVRGRPLARTADLATVPIRLYHGTADLACPPAAVQALVGAVPGASAVVIDTQLDHGDALMAKTPAADVVRFANDHP